MPAERTHSPGILSEIGRSVIFLAGVHCVIPRCDNTWNLQLVTASPASAQDVSDTLFLLDPRALFPGAFAACLACAGLHRSPISMDEAKVPGPVSRDCKENGKHRFLVLYGPGTVGSNGELILANWLRGISADPTVPAPWKYWGIRSNGVLLPAD